MAKSKGVTVVNEALRSCRAHFALAFAFNAVGNVLLFAFPLFTMQVYDRVLGSRSLETLAALSIGVALALTFKAVFQWVRGALLVRASARLDRQLGDRVLIALVERSAAGHKGADTQVLRDLDRFRQFTTGTGAVAAVEAPWAALFVGALLMINLTVGLVALGSIVILSLATVLNTLATKRRLAASNEAALDSYHFAEANLRSSDAVLSMGMLNGVIRKWRAARNPALRAQIAASQRNIVFNSALTSLRYAMQAAIMVAGVWEVLFSGAPSGVLFAAVIVSGFAMQPVQQIISAWEEYVPVRDGLRRIQALLATPPRSRDGMTLPRPAGELRVQGLFYVPEGVDQPILRNINLRIAPGESLGLLGLNGSGKSTLAKLLVGNLKPTRGDVRLGGADMWGSNRDDLGRYIGYLPQNISLLTGSVAENIGRFGLFAEEEIIAAAQMAGVHDLILKLPQGYDTQIGEGGHPLSGGQRQLIGLARAVAGHPSLVVLDEPNASLDTAAEGALMACLGELKARGISVVLITHKTNLVRNLDHALILKEGVVARAGSTQFVFGEARPVLVNNTAAKQA
jgi:PrtD family type I secretion system ABC transporter